MMTTMLEALQDPKRTHVGWWLALVIVAAVLPYSAVPTHDWLNWDDNWLMWDNPALDTADLATVKMVLFDLSLEARNKLGDEYLPLRDLSIMLDKQLWGNEPGGYLLENVLFYGVTAGLFFLLVLRVYGDRAVALLAGLLFAVHPVHVEAVAWATSRKDMLSAMFFMAAAVAFEGYLQDGKRSRLPLSWVLFALAVAGKATAIVLPIWLVLRLAWVGIERGGRRFWLKSLGLLAPFAAIAAFQLYLLVRVGATTAVLAPTRPSGSLLLDLATTVIVNWRYLFNLVCPYRLSPDYPVRTLESLMSLQGAIVIGSVALFAAFVAVALRAILRRRGDAVVWTVTLFWTLWFFGSQLPFSQIAPIHNKMTDRYLMLPSMSFAALVGFFVARAWGRRRGVAIPVVATAGLLVLALLTARQASFWKDSIAIWSRGAAAQPTSVLSHFQLATAYKDAGMMDEERAALERTLELDPENAGALENLAINLFRSGADRAEVIALFERLIRLHPADFKAQQNLANVLIAEGRYDEAIGRLQRSLQINPGYCAARLNMGRAYMHKGESAAARAWFEEALVCNPRMDAARGFLERLQADKR